MAGIIHHPACNARQGKGACNMGCGPGNTPSVPNPIKKTRKPLRSTPKPRKNGK